MAGGSNFLSYIKAAFLNKWNLLFFGASVAFGFIAGRLDIVLPLAAAVELLYLAVLSMNPRFQKVVDAVEGQSERADAAPSTDRTARELLNGLSLDDQQQFQRLRNQCLELRRVSAGVKGQADGPGSPVVTDMQLSNINRLLWIYLKVLYSKRSLETFFRSTSEHELQETLKRAQDRITALGPENEDTPQEVKNRISLNDTCQTSEMRLKNYLATKENYEFIQLELERLHTKIAGIAEMGINRQDTQFITSEIDVVSSSVQQTEKTVHELESVTGYSFGDSEPPSLLDMPVQGRERQRE